MVETNANKLAPIEARLDYMDREELMDLWKGLYNWRELVYQAQERREIPPGYVDLVRTRFEENLGLSQLVRDSQSSIELVERSRYDGCTE